MPEYVNASRRSSGRSSEFAGQPHITTPPTWTEQIPRPEWKSYLVLVAWTLKHPYVFG